ncbi:hypothetical protein ACUNWD_06985 [Sunxiuqinia sp. A32]|uniref:hypothetical protein n=1 Tax=Sunxiuqinia sp. A32 TaxID=3461496 RepID=UPI004045EC71
MKQVRLELDSIEMLTKRDRWNLYFIIYTTHPEDSSKSLVAMLPKAGTIQLTNKSEDIYRFRPKQNGSDGLKVFQSKLPDNNSVSIRLSLMQSRKKLRNTFEYISELKGKLDIDGSKILKLTNIEWLVIDSSIDIVADALSKMKDRNLGFISMDEEFEDEFFENPNQERSGVVSTGKARLRWTWELKEV